MAVNDLDVARDWVSPSGRLMRSPETRFWAKVDRSGGPDACWPWVAAISGFGYGTFWSGVRKERAHRFSYELLVGPIPEGLELDHLCRVRHCVNPAHLEPVTTRENVLRGIAPTAINARKTHCSRGHPYMGDNLYRQAGVRFCRQCRSPKR